MWLEEKLGERINQVRFGQLAETGTDDCAVSCPFCNVMISNAQQEVGKEEARTFDVIQLVARAAGLES